MKTHYLNVSENKLQLATLDWHVGSVWPTRPLPRFPRWPQTTWRFSRLGSAPVPSAEPPSAGRDGISGALGKRPRGQPWATRTLPAGPRRLGVSGARPRAPSINPRGRAGRAICGADAGRARAGSGDAATRLLPPSPCLPLCCALRGHLGAGRAAPPPLLPAAPG